MTQVVKRAEPLESNVQPYSETESLMSVIAAAARDPQTDVGKMERLLEMYERMTAQRARGAYAEALSQMQQELPVIEERGQIKNSAGKVQSRYALWEDINEAIKPVLQKYGFAISFRTGRDDGQIIVTGVLSHRDGHSEETTIYLPTDTSGSKNAVQAVGSSTSYGKRYTAAALLNLTSRGEDDDGVKGGSGPAVTDAQRDQLIALIDEVGANTRSFCKYLKVDSIAAIPAARYDDALKALEAKRKPK